MSLEHEELTGKIIGCAYQVHKVLGHGFLERVYEIVFKLELEEVGLFVEQQTPIVVFYKEIPVGEYFADLFIDNRVIVEMKTVQNLAKEHEMQLVNYLTATGIDIGLLINFGKSVEVKRKFREYKPAKVRRLDGEGPKLSSIQPNPVSPVNPVN